MSSHKHEQKFSKQRTYNAALHLLNTIFEGNVYPDILLGKFFQQEKFTSEEKKAIVELVYEIIRHRGKIDHIIGNTSRAVVSKLDLNILNILRLCAYEATSANTSSCAVINNAIALSSKEGMFKGFIKRTMEAIIRNRDNLVFPDIERDPIKYISIFHSHPVWIVEKWAAELKDIDEVEDLCKASNLPPPLMIRVNPLKTTIPDLQKALLKDGYSTSTTGFSPYGLVVDKKENIFRTNAFRNGDFEVQDEGSQLITLLAGARQGECVIDACAGNGGKTLFLSGRMQNTGIVIASDNNPSKFRNLRRRADRAGAFNIKTATIDELLQYTGRADRVFIDAPCSGMGVFRRNPDSKWRLRKQDILELSKKQKEILKSYSSFVKPGGWLVYATCTISREENEDVVWDFLEKNECFHLIPPSEVDPGIFGRFASQDGFFRSMPHIHGTDGFFGAVMMRRKIELTNSCSDMKSVT
ncbi:MAG: 16S rRNA (cytosine(967)-C(5))-methyltransferase RsmB [Candidatus Methanoperedens sp.]|nr:16S rRNA (cytosine(967)-C(5))-methyltransferase RsmB [Candidatus Methanoperedens sp.]